MRLMLECDPTPFFCVICISPKVDKVDSQYLSVISNLSCATKLKYLHTAVYNYFVLHVSGEVCVKPPWKNCNNSIKSWISHNDDLVICTISAT